MTRVARKNHQIKVLRPAAQIAAMNLASVVNQFSAHCLRLRKEKPVPPRRRIAILMFAGKPEPVRIRHVQQNLDSAVNSRHGLPPRV